MKQDRWQQGQELKPVLPTEKMYDASIQMGYGELQPTVLSSSHIRARKLHCHHPAVCEFDYVKRT